MHRQNCVHFGWDMCAYSRAKVDAYLVKHLLDDLFALLFILESRDIVDGVVHHLLPLIHNVVLLLELHGDALQGGEVHLLVHASEECYTALVVGGSR